LAEGPWPWYDAAMRVLPRLTRRRLAGCALLALAALAGGAWWSVSPGRVTRANYDKIPHPTTAAQVVATLGRPDYDQTVIHEGRRIRQLGWERINAWASFEFDELGHVEASGFDEQDFRGFWRSWWIRHFHREPPFQWPWH
jgi:hypothetical protein